MGEALNNTVSPASFTREASTSQAPVDVAIILDISGGMFDDLQATLKKVKDAMRLIHRVQAKMSPVTACIVVSKVL